MLRSEMTLPNSAAVMMSRLTRLVPPDALWIAGLRGVLRQLKASQTTLLLSEKTAGAPFLQQAAARLGVEQHFVSVPEGVDTASDRSVADQSLMDAAEVVYVLHLRSGGNLERLLKERLQQRQSRVVLVDLPQLQPDNLRAELCAQGATSWTPTTEQLSPLVAAAALKDLDRTSEASTDPPDVYTLSPFPPAEEWDFLAHSTRACPGPWPGDSFAEYADSLLEARSDADHSALSALLRIIRQKTLIASGRTIRGGDRVVSFTAIPLSELPSLRRFRPHRVHWDFEPYGICLRRSWLLSRGAQAVNYAEEADWPELTAQQRPFFQRAIGHSGIDWRVEQEWRVVGDLGLRDAAPQDVIVFVPHFEAAKAVARITSWPVTLWPDDAS
ncbi:hypothetical protein [Schlesneria sp.]|uniref:hypothetical protein n=1 Tax=Schlesneria sp. TaxID=2762018 RepID=UPI002EE0ED28